MASHLVVGAGAVGRETARELCRRGEQALLASRSGTGPAVDGVNRVAVDAADADALSELTQGSLAVYNCVNPPAYHLWAGYWPPVARALLTAAERSGAVLVTAGNLYGYGPVSGAMVEGLPDAADGVKGRLRAQMWQQAKQAHDEGRLRAVEVRGSDYMGPGVKEAHLPHVAPRALAGKAVRVFGDPKAPHAFTDVRDMGRALVAVALEPKAHGRVWHAPTNPAVSQRQTIEDVCTAVGRKPVPVRAWPSAMLSVGGVAVPFLRELRETVYQFQSPYLLDSSAIEHELGLSPTPWQEVCRATAESALG